MKRRYHFFQSLLICMISMLFFSFPVSASSDSEGVVSVPLSIVDSSQSGQFPIYGMRKYGYVHLNLGARNLVSGLNPDSYYEFHYTVKFRGTSNEKCRLMGSSIEYGGHLLGYNGNGQYMVTEHSATLPGTFIARGSDVVGKDLFFRSTVVTELDISNVNFNFDVDILIDSYTEISYGDGYEAGYNDAMDRIEGMGADATKYPVFIDDHSWHSKYYVDKRYCQDGVTKDYIASDQVVFSSLIGIKPDHVYKVVFAFDSLQRNAQTHFTYSNFDLFLQVGACTYPLQLFSNTGSSVVYIPGDLMSNVFHFHGFFRNATYRYSVGNSTVTSGGFMASLNQYIEVYDMGPCSTKNDIANQTDILTNGYDDSAGSAANDAFKGSSDALASAEDSLFQSASSGMKDFKFFDLKSVPALLTGLSFVNSVIVSMFNSMGGLSGAGIVLSVLFCIVFVTIIIGIRKYYSHSGSVKRKG